MEQPQINLIEPEHQDDEWCWCGPRVERYEEGDVIIHRTLQEIIEAQETLSLEVTD